MQYIKLSQLSVWPLVTLGLLSSLAFGVVFSPVTHADTTITLSPTAHRLEIEPKKTYNGALTVINSGNDQLDIRVYSAPYQVQNEAYDPVFSKDTPRTQISRWVKFEKDSYTLAPSQQLRVPYTITTPDSIPEGGQYAAIFAETNDKPDGAIVRKKRVGMLVYAKPQGETNESGKVELAAPGILQLGSDLTLRERLINSGNTDLTGEIDVRATDLFGKEVFSQKQQKVVLPDTARQVPVEWKNTPGVSIVKLSQAVQFAGKKTTNEQWVLLIKPLWALTISAAITLIIGGVIYAIHRPKKRQKIRRLR